MTAPTITGADRVVDRYGAGVYRFGNNRGLSVAVHYDLDELRALPLGALATGVGWDAVELLFTGPGDEDFTCARDDEGVVRLRLGLTDDELAEMAAEISERGDR